MKKLEAIIPPSRVDAVRSALTLQCGLEGLTVSEVWGVGSHPRATALYRGSEYEVDLAPRVKVEAVVHDRYALPGVYAIVDAARMGSPADARVLVVPVADAVRIRTGEHGAVAIDGTAVVSSDEPTPRHLPLRPAARLVTAHG